MKLLTLALLLLFLPCNVSADEEKPWTGNWLYRICNGALDENFEDSQEFFEAGQCLGFVVAAEHTFLLTMAALDQQPEVCMPNDVVEVHQTIEVVVNYLKAHPEQRHIDAVALTLTAIREAFPCEESASP